MVRKTSGFVSLVKLLLSCVPFHFVLRGTVADGSRVYSFVFFFFVCGGTDVDDAVENLFVINHRQRFAQSGFVFPADSFLKSSKCKIS